MEFYTRLSIKTKFLITAAVAFGSVVALGLMYFWIERSYTQANQSQKHLLELRSLFAHYDAQVAHLPNIPSSDFKFFKYGENNLVHEIQLLDDKLSGSLASLAKDPVVTKHQLRFRVNNLYTNFDAYGRLVFHLVELLKQRGNHETGQMGEYLATSKEIYKFAQKLSSTPAAAEEYLRFATYEKQYFISADQAYTDELAWYLNHVTGSMVEPDNPYARIFSIEEHKQFGSLVGSSIDHLTKLKHLAGELAPDQPNGAWASINALGKDILAEFDQLTLDYNRYTQASNRRGQLWANLLVGLAVAINALLLLLFAREMRATFRGINHTLRNIHQIEPLAGRTDTVCSELSAVHARARMIITDRSFLMQALDRLIAGQNLQEIPVEVSSNVANKLQQLSQHILRIQAESKLRQTEEEISSWQIRGQTTVESIFRTQSVQIKELSHALIKGLIDFLNVNQGAIFLYNEDERVLQLFAAYSLGKFKAVSQRFELGDGLVGSCALEQKPIYITDVPADYFSIRSGLGEAIPRAIYLLPLALDKRLYGVLEIASFEALPSYVRDFLENISLSIASGFSRIKTSYESELLTEKIRRESNLMQQRERELLQRLESHERAEEQLRQQLSHTQSQLQTSEARLARSKASEEVLHMEVLKYQERIKQLSPSTEDPTGPGHQPK